MSPAKTKHPYTAVMRRDGPHRHPKIWVVKVRGVPIERFKQRKIAAKYCYWHNKWVSKHA
jgi:hypothetical protein